MEIKQNRYSDKRFFRLDDDGVFFKIKSPTEDVSGKFKYEDLGLSTLTVRNKEASWIFILMAMIGMFALRFIIEATQESETVNALDIMFIVLGCITAFGGLFFVIIETRKELIGITDGSKTFSMHRNVPTTPDVDNFINELQVRIKDRIITLNVRPTDMNMDEDYKLYQLQSLLDANVINKEKFSEVEKQIKSLRQNKAIGFTR